MFRSIACQPSFRRETFFTRLPYVQSNRKSFHISYKSNYFGDTDTIPEHGSMDPVDWLLTGNFSTKTRSETVFICNGIYSKLWRLYQILATGKETRILRGYAKRSFRHSEGRWSPQWRRKHFPVTGPLWRESIGHRWISLTKASDTELGYFLWSTPTQTVEQTMETPVIWCAIMTSVHWLCQHTGGWRPDECLADGKMHE